MKKILPIALALLLCGCSAQPSGSNVSSVPEPAVTFADPVDLNEDYSDPADAVPHTTSQEEQMRWSEFLFLDAAGKGEIAFSDPDHPEARTIVRREDGSYALTEDGKTTVYAHLIHSIESSPPGSACNTSEYILLSNDETMTGRRYMASVLSSTIAPENNAIMESTALVYADAFQLDRVEPMGDCPYTDEQLALLGKGIFCENSFFVLDAPAARLSRYDYDFNLLCTVDGATGAPVEYEDGFLCVDSAITRYDGQGTALWSSPFPDGYRYADTAIVDGSIYTVGSVEVDGYDRVHLCRLSPDGTICGERILEGDDFDNPYHFTDGLTLIGSTQSRTGDLALSQDGYPVGFSVRIDENLELTDLELTDLGYTTAIGWHNGAEIRSDYGKVDGIFDMCDRFITVRSHPLGIWPLEPVYMSRQMYYCEDVITCYAPDGTILWRSVGPLGVK